MTIRAVLYNPVSRKCAQGGLELIDAWQQQPESLLWADFTGAEFDAHIETLSQRFFLHPMAIQDAQRQRHPPKLEEFDRHTFILLKGLGKDMVEFEFETIQIALFVNRRFLITRHTEPSPSIDRCWREIERRHDMLARGTDVVALRIARIVVDRYVEKLLSLEPRLEELEVQMAKKPSDKMLSELTGYKTNLRKFRRVFLYHVQLFAQLAAEPPTGIDAAHIHEINDVYENQERATSLATLYYELASDLIDGYISLASHRLNYIIKILTIVTTIFVPLSFLAGIYGMNFEYMPELHSKSGYFILLAIMGLIVVMLLSLFRRMRWI